MTTTSSVHSIRWVTGYPGCGKTTVGDYLAKYIGYVHVEVDDDFMLARCRDDGKPDPYDKILTAYLKSWGDFFSDKAPSSDDFGPFLKLVCNRILSLQKEQMDGGAPGGAKIVVTQGMHRFGRARNLFHWLGSKRGEENRAGPDQDGYVCSNISSGMVIRRSVRGTHWPEVYFAEL